MRDLTVQVPQLPALRIFLVDDHQIMREGLRMALCQEPDFSVVGQASDGRTALERVQQLLPEVVIMDVGLPDGDGLLFARQILTRWPMIRVIILSAIGDRKHLDQALEAGVAGYLLKTNASSELVTAIRKAVRGEVYLCPEMSALLLGGYRRLLAAARKQDASALSERETEVLRRIADGQNTKQIAGELGVSVKTIETHRTRIMARLGLHSVAELTRYAIRHGISQL